MANQCPNCAKPVRSGAKFCGFCGHVLQEADPGTTKPKASAQSSGAYQDSRASINASPAGESCPYCGKINRPGVKFCASCGKQLSPDVPAAPPPTSPPLSETPLKRSRPRIVTVGFLVLVIVIVCASLLGIAYGFGWIDRLFPQDTPTSTAMVAEPPTETPIDSTPTLTATAEPTMTETPTATIPPSETPTPTITNTPTPEIIFEDDFQDDLDHWQAWENRPLIGSDLLPPETILGDLLDLKGFNDDKVGVTSLQTITLQSGLVIEFDAEVDNALGASLYFDWYPGEEARSPVNLGPIYLEISNTEIRFHYQSDGNEVDCLVALQASAMRTYRIEFGTGFEVILFVEDGKMEEVCRAFVDQPEQLSGRITFSGFGLVDRVWVFLP